MELLKIFVLCVGAAVSYGIAHDMVTAHLCLEYFTVGHPRLFATDVPAAHALAWGVIATWWVGVALGPLLMMAARAGRRPRRGARELVRPLVRLQIAVGIIAVLFGLLGFMAASSGRVGLRGSLADAVPVEKHARFLAAAWMHLASYGFGALGTLVLAIRILVARRRERRSIELAERLAHRRRAMG